jgi:hypothetical protein
MVAQHWEGTLKLPHRRQFLHLAAGAAALPFAPHVARAQAYPSRPVRLVVGYPAGGGTDITARLIGQWLSERLAQPFITENRPGAGSNIATEAVVRAPPDGYTLLVFGPAAAINTTFYSAARNNVPAVYPQSFFARDGGLLYYGVDSLDIWRRAASYVDRILRGAKPGDLPVQFPTKFEMVVNRGTAKALGLAVPLSILVRADEVIE